MSIRILNCDVLDGLAQLIDESVHCVVTSPPYWGLRDYGVDGQIGLEATPNEFVGRMVEVFREVRRVLRKDGTCWVNLGDSYAGSWGAQSRGDDYPGGLEGTSPMHARKIKAAPVGGTGVGSLKRTPGLKPKDLIGIPWRVALALQADGWWLRSEIIWSKPNPMPESVTDRPTKAHEHVFFLAKSERYYYDDNAIKEDRASAGGSFVAGWATGPSPHNAVAHARDKGDARSFRSGGKYTEGRERSSAAVPRETRGNGPALSALRNRRTVWSIATTPFSEAHFATFPPDLPEICIKAGCPVGGTVLDPFGGAGTTGLVADRLQRNAILIELNPEYAAMARRRIDSDRGGLLDAMESHP